MEKRKTSKPSVDTMDPGVREFIQHEVDLVVDDIVKITTNLQWKACLHPDLRKAFNTLCRAKEDISRLGRR